MEKYVVSARKYRPAKFEDVVGQEHITHTLKNALINNQLAHAFLFCGPRGVGKTTCARILAKVINCLTPTADMEACDTCRSCVAFNETSSFNIYELDAASNNSVDDIRGLIEQVRVPPQGGKYKVYIIDEVHMLTAAAFNAFLKTLEEPPSYAKFILATTERHKILPTILSRCQVFDFSRIKPESIVEQLVKIAADRKVTVDEDSLHLIAQKADGGLRDALSMFDKMASFCSGNINITEVLDQLNILDADFYFKVTDALLAEDIAIVLNTFQLVLQKGFEGDTFLYGLGEHFRNLLMGKDATTIPLLEVSVNVRKKYLQQSVLTPTSFILSALNIINESDINYRLSKNKRLHVELALIRLCYLNATLSNLGSQIEKKKIAVAESPAPTYAATTTSTTATLPITVEPKAQVPKPVEKSTTTASTTTETGATKTVSSTSAASTFSIKDALERAKQTAAIKTAEQLAKPTSIETAAVEVKTVAPVKADEPLISKTEKPYTPMQKFDAMSLKNPQLIELMKVMKLDVEW